MKSFYTITLSAFVITNLACTSHKAQCSLDGDSAPPSEQPQCTPDGVCLVPPPKKPSALVPPVAGSGPSFNPGTADREGRIVQDEASGLRPFPKQLWADSYLFRELPLLSETGEILQDQRLDGKLSSVERINGFLKIESWYNQPPADYRGKFVLIEFAASWCSACKRSLKHIEHFHETFPNEMVVISVFETGAAQNDDFPRPGAGREIKHSIGIDTRRRCANALGIYGIPHAVLIEPEAGVVVWEGMVHQIGYELTDDLLKKFFAIGLAK
jgi:cytochrome c biogenesis protein CcmG, thiol:disulfide interchange protein DsbE